MKNNQKTTMYSQIITEEETQKKVEKLTKKYEENFKELLRDYDDIVKKSMISLIADVELTGFVRDDLLITIDRLFIIRKYICDNYCQKSGNYDEN